MPFGRFAAWYGGIVAAVGFGLAGVASGAEVLATVSGLEPGVGEVGCALYAGEDGFPMDPSKAEGQRHAVERTTVECRWEGLAAGEYAVAASVDFNGNGKTDKNFFGIPKEPWGVSNNVRPGMRAPRFREAKFTVAEGETVQLEIEVKK